MSDADSPTTPQDGSLGSRTTARALKNNPAGLATLRAVARREFVARGYHAVSIRDIAKEAGLSLSVLYHYYASKQELLYGVLNEAVDNFASILEQHSFYGDLNDPVNRFLALVESVIEYRATLQIDSLLFIREVRNLDDDFADRLAGRRDEVRALFDGVIADGREAGVFKTPYPDDARRTLIATLNAIPEWYQSSGTLTVEDLVARYSHLALAIVEYTGSLGTSPLR